MLFGVRVFVIVPAFNEAPRIARVLSSMPPSVDAIVVVDDASLDGTARAVREVNDPRVVLVQHSRNRGVGATIATGYRKALSLASEPLDAFVVMAGDGQMDPGDLPALVKPIAERRADYVKGDRFRSPDVHRRMPFVRRMGGKVLSRLTSLAIGQAISDSQCGYTALSRHACAQLELDELWPGYGYPNDLLGQIAAQQFSIAEREVQAIYADEESGLRPYHAFQIAGLIARVWVRRNARRLTRVLAQ